MIPTVSFSIRATHIPVGDDQLQHLELTREIARSFNSLYKEGFFPKPQPILSKGNHKDLFNSIMTITGTTHRIMSLRNPLKKMSKSDNQELTRVNLDDTPEQVYNKIRKSVTDCTSEITYDPVNRPGVSNLVEIYSAITGSEPQDIVEQFIGKDTVALKDSLADVIINHLKPLQIKMKELSNDEGYIEEVLAIGANKAREKAIETLTDIKKLLGID